MRCAIIFVPPADNALTQAASAWLRRDVYTGAALSSSVEGLIERDHAFVTAIPRRYGLHAIMKPIFSLAPGRPLAELDRQLKSFCSRLESVTVDLHLAAMDGCFCLALARRNADLDMLAARVVAEFDGFRANVPLEPLGEREQPALTGRQISNLMNWGAPFVFDQFRFSLALTGPVDRRERQHVEHVLRRFLGPLIETTVSVDQLCVVVEPEPLAPFIIHSVHRFGQVRDRKSA